MALPNNNTTSDPSLRDLLSLLKRDVMASTNCHAIGIVQSFNPTTQTASITLAYKKTVFKTSPVNEVPQAVLTDYPPLTDVPVISLGGGAASLTFPIKKGDECLLLFNDRDLDNWFQGGPPQGVATRRTHSFSDAVALVGLRSAPNALANFDAARAVLRNGNAMVGVGTELVKIANEVTTLKTIINGLIDIIAAATVAVPPGPGSPTPFPLVNSAALLAYKTTVGGLLE